MWQGRAPATLLLLTLCQAAPLVAKARRDTDEVADEVAVDTAVTVDVVRAETVVSMRVSKPPAERVSCAVIDDSAAVRCVQCRFSEDSHAQELHYGSGWDI